MLSIIYSSAATGEFTDSDLAVLLMNSRANNKRLGLTGLLLYKDGHFVQLLEGDMAVVRERMAIIAADPRHEHVGTLLEEVIQHRRFPDWTMGYEAVEDTMVDTIPGYRVTFDDLAGSQTPSGASLLALRQMVGWFQDRADADADADANPVESQ